jgi:hypothetical protein
MATSEVPFSVHRKIILHWSLMRMECHPEPFPLRASSRFPGGTKRSDNASAECRAVSFLAAIRDICENRLFLSVRNSSSVSRSENERIMNDQWLVRSCCWKIGVACNQSVSSELFACQAVAPQPLRVVTFLSRTSRCRPSRA